MTSQHPILQTNIKTRVSLEDYCRSSGIAKKSGFYYSLLGLSSSQRKALTAVYVFCREVDDIVDECIDSSIAEVKLNFWFQEIERVFLNTPSHPIGFALAEVCDQYPLKKEHFKGILNGMLMDLQHNHYQDFTALSGYCYAVASCVGLLVIEVLGYSDAVQTQRFAIKLGTALQLVNIIRDVGEDVRRGRIYLPQEELQQFSVTEQDILKGRYSDNFQALMQYQATRAKKYYQDALQALNTVSRSDYRKQQPSLIMGKIYFDLLNELEKSNFQVLHQKIKLTKTRKLWVALSTILKIKFRKR